MAEPSSDLHSKNVTPDQTKYGFTVAGIFILCLISYWPSMRGGFLWDDDYYVTDNTALRSFGGLQKLWTGIYPDPQSYPVPQYYPMTHTSFWLQTRGVNFNRPLNPTPFHVINVLLHACSAWMLWMILKKLAVPGALLIALIFAVHPLQVESVAWITERKNVLSGFFLFASLLVYLRFCGLDPKVAGTEDDTFALPVERGKIYALALVLFVASILSKSVTGSMPAVLLLIFWWKRGRITKDDLLPLLPFFVLAIAMGSITSWMERTVVGAQGAEWNYSILTRTMIAGRAAWFYLMKLIVPVNLMFMYPKWAVDPKQLWQMIFPLGVIAAVVALYAYRSRIGRGPVVSVLLFLGLLFPALGFINVFPMRYSFVADHFQYLACIGIIILIVAGAHHLARNQQAITITFGVIICILAGATFRQNQNYTDLETLWKHTIEKNPASWMAHNNYGSMLFKQRRMDEALHEFKEAFKYKRDHTEAVMNIGLVAERAGALDAAIGRYRDAIMLVERDPVRRKAHAEPYFHLGVALARVGKIDEAIAAYQKAIEINPRHLLALNNQGALLLEKNDVPNATQRLSQAIEVAPEFAGSHVNMGNALARDGKMDDAMEEWKLAAAIDPTNTALMNNIGMVLASNNLLKEAVTQFQKAIAVNPKSVEAHTNLGIVLGKLNQRDMAMAELEMALQLDPNFALAKKALTSLREWKSTTTQSTTTQSTTAPAIATQAATQPARNP